MQGKIIKGIAGFYYIYAEDGNIYECKAKGIFPLSRLLPDPPGGPSALPAARTALAALLVVSVLAWPWTGAREETDLTITGETVVRRWDGSTGGSSLFFCLVYRDAGPLLYGERLDLTWDDLDHGQGR